MERIDFSCTRIREKQEKNQGNQTRGSPKYTNPKKMINLTALDMNLVKIDNPLKH